MCPSHHLRGYLRALESGIDDANFASAAPDAGGTLGGHAALGSLPPPSRPPPLPAHGLHPIVASPHPSLSSASGKCRKMTRMSSTPLKGVSGTLVHSIHSAKGYLCSFAATSTITPWATIPICSAEGFGAASGATWVSFKLPVSLFRTVCCYCKCNYSARQVQTWSQLLLMQIP